MIKKKIDLGLIAMLVAITFLMVILFSSCYTEKKATEQVNKADSKFPQVVAKLARDKYPCTELLKNDTAVIFQDSIIYLECPDTSLIFESIKFDTAYKVVTKTVRVPVTVRIPSQVITKYFEDSAKLKLCSIAIDNLTADNKDQAATIKKQDRKIGNKNKENWIWRAIALALIAWQAWKFYRRLTTLKIT